MPGKAQASAPNAADADKKEPPRPIDLSAFRVEAWVLRNRIGERLKVTEAEFVMVAVDEDGRPRPVRKEAAA